MSANRRFFRSAAKIKNMHRKIFHFKYHFKVIKVNNILVSIVL